MDGHFSIFSSHSILKKIFPNIYENKNGKPIWKKKKNRLNDSRLNPPSAFFLVAQTKADI